MPQYVKQLWGQDFRNGVAVQVWSFVGFDEADDVDARIKEFNDGEIPLVWAGLPVDTNWGIAEVGGGVWTVTVSFSSKAGNILDPTAAETADHPDHGGDAGSDQELAGNISYSIRNGTQKITQSLETIKTAATGGRTADNHGRAIGVKDGPNGEVEGCEVYAGEVTWTLKGKVPVALVTGDYVTKLTNLSSPRPKLNRDEFFGFRAGELLILQAELGEATSNGFRDIACQFGVKFNQDIVELSEDPPLALEDVGGWSHVWCKYERQEQTVGGETRMAMLPAMAYEERVYDYGDFDDLQIKKFKKKTVTTP